MYLLDTNVVSALRRPATAEANLVRWSSARDISEFFLSVITLLELHRGTLLVGRRDPHQGAILSKWIDGLLEAFADRVLSIDTTVALRCAELHVPDPKSERDALIAATALVHGMTVATRNVSDFERTGVKLINPWNEATG